jgi:hypothetical protein
MAGKKNKRRERFPIHEIGRIDGGRVFRTGGNVLQIGGNAFYNWKNKILMKIPEFKRSGIRIIAEFRGILRGFPNQDCWYEQQQSNANPHSVIISRLIPL